MIEPALSGEDRPLARLICEETDRIRDLIDHMEVFSDERPPEREPVNIHAVLERVKAITGAGMTMPITIREDYDPSLPPVFAAHLKQVMPQGVPVVELPRHINDPEFADAITEQVVRFAGATRK